MNYVAQEDIIVAVDANINLIRGSAQQYTVKIFRDYVGNQLNASKIDLISIAALKSNGDKALLYSNVYSAGVSDGVSIGKAIDLEQGEVTFEITENQSLALEAGDLNIQVTLTYSNFYPNSKTYRFPILKIGSTSNAVQGPGSIPNGTGGAAPGTGDGDGNGGGTISAPKYGQHEFAIEYIDGTDPTTYGKLSVNSDSVENITEITYVMLDADLIRITSLENFLENRISAQGSRGTITLFSKETPSFYSIFNIVSWERIDITPGNGDTEDSDGIKITVEFESVSSGPGVTKSQWEVGDSAVYALDGYGIDSVGPDEKGILTYVDKNIECTVATSGNESPTGVRMTYSPFYDSYILVEVNGISVEVGDGVKTQAAYFSGDNGSTALLIEEIRNSDQLIWNGDIAGFELEIGDDINLIYEALADDIR